MIAKAPLDWFSVLNSEMHIDNGPIVTAGDGTNTSPNGYLGKDLKVEKATVFYRAQDGRWTTEAVAVDGPIMKKDGSPSKRNTTLTYSLGAPSIPDWVEKIAAHSQPLGPVPTSATVDFVPGPCRRTLPFEEYGEYGPWDRPSGTTHVMTVGAPTLSLPIHEAKLLIENGPVILEDDRHICGHRGKRMQVESARPLYRSNGGRWIASHSLSLYGRVLKKDGTLDMPTHFSYAFNDPDLPEWAWQMAQHFLPAEQPPKATADRLELPRSA